MRDELRVPVSFRGKLVLFNPLRAGDTTFISVAVRTLT
jgi:hypothetical protein